MLSSREVCHLLSLDWVLEGEAHFPCPCSLYDLMELVTLTDKSSLGGPGLQGWCFSSSICKAVTVRQPC